MYTYTVGIGHLSVLVHELMALKCVCFSVCACAANIRPLSGSQFADGAPAVPDVRRGVEVVGTAGPIGDAGW